jgi:hypothetical protein
MYEIHAAQVRLQSGVEYLHCQYLVEPKNVEEYLEFVTANYEHSVVEAHMARYGNLDRLTPTGYVPYFKIFGPNGTVVDTMERPIRSAMWQISPRKYFTHFMFKSTPFTLSKSLMIQYYEPM